MRWAVTNHTISPELRLIWVPMTKPPIFPLQGPDALPLLPVLKRDQFQQDPPTSAQARQLSFQLGNPHRQSCGLLLRVSHPRHRRSPLTPSIPRLLPIYSSHAKEAGIADLPVVLYV